MILALICLAALQDDLVEQLSSDDPKIREQAAAVLIKEGPRILPRLEKLLDAEDIDLRNRVRAVVLEIRKSTIDVRTAREITNKDFAYTWCVAATADGSTILLGTEAADLVIVRDTEARKFDCGSDTLTAVAVSPDGKRGLACSVAGEVQLWDLDQGKKTRSLHDIRDRVESACYSPDGKRAFIAAGKAVYEVKDSVSKILEGFPGLVTFVHFDGKRFLLAYMESNAMDNRHFVVELREDGKPAKRFLGGDGYATYAALSPDGKLLMACGNCAYKGFSANAALNDTEDKTLIVWDVESEKEVRKLVSCRKHVGVLQYASFVTNELAAVAHLYGKLELIDLRSGDTFKTAGIDSDKACKGTLAGDRLIIVSKTTLRVYEIKK